MSGRRLLCAMVLLAAAGAARDAAAKDLIRVEDGPYISGGAFYIARDEGLFDKLGLEIQTRYFNDGALAVPAFVAGELDLGGLTAAASLFNSIAKGAPLVVLLDRGRNGPGQAYTLTAVTNAIYDSGIKTLADIPKLKGKRIGVSALGSINQYNFSRALMKFGIDPVDGVQWVVNIPQPDLMKMLGQDQIDATEFAYQFGIFAQNQKLGHVIATGDEMAPGGQIALFGGRKDFIAQHRDAVVRFAMAYLQGIKIFNAAAAAPDKYPEVLAILAKNTVLNKPELVKSIAPHWASISPDGMPNVQSVMDMQNMWAGHPFKLVDHPVSEAQLFDLSIARDAKARLDQEKPFGG